MELPRVEEYASVEEVLRLVLREAGPCGEHQVDARRAFGRICARRVVAPRDVPGVPRSHMDGFAVRASDLGYDGAPVELPVQGELGPGASRRRALAPRRAVKVATGAPLPEGADTVVPVEMALEAGGKITIGSAPERGSFVYPQGADVGRGDVLLRPGVSVRAQDVGLLLSLGIERLRVYRKPRVGLLATGSELTNRRPGPGKIRNSHAPVFLSLVEGLGCVPVDMGIAKDRLSMVTDRLRRALATCECVFTLGGTSVGKRDIVGAAVSELHPEAEFHGIRMDRGRVAGMAAVKGKPVLMMPGPVQGAMNAFLLLGVPALGVLSGRSQAVRKVRCTLGEGWEARKRFSGFVKVVYVKLGEGGKTARPISGDTESMAVLSQADGFLVVPEEVTSIEEGTEVEVGLLPGFSFA